MGSRRPNRPSPFRIGGTTIPGVATTTSGFPGTYSMPGFGSPALQGLGREPSPMLQGRRAAIQSREALAKSVGLAFPPNKRPRGNPVAPGNVRPIVPGRGTTPSFLYNAVMAAGEAERDWDTGDRTRDFISIPRVVKVDKHGLTFALALKGQLVFNQKSGFEESGRGSLRPSRSGVYGRRTGGVQSVDGISRLLSLPALNYFLRRNDYERVLDPDLGSTWITPHHVLEDYPLEGVVRTGAMESERPAFRNVSVREYTVTIAQRDPDTTNIWGHVRQMQPLYLIIKRIPKDQLPTEYVISAIDKRRLPAPGHDGGGGGGGRYHPDPIQVVPWSDPIKREPDLADRLYVDSITGTEKIGIVIRVGWANYASSASNLRAVRQAWYNASSLMDLPRIDITLNIRSKS